MAPTSIPWTHPPFKDAANQIRLLSISISDGENPMISCVCYVYDRKDAPRYNAISYTWGEAQDTKSITIDGQLFQVRSNCHHALRQTQLHHPSELLWIDSICIDQKNLQEKGAQVASIGTTFSCAARVIACVGRHTASSRILHDTVARGPLINLFDPLLDIETPEWIDALLQVDRQLVINLSIAVCDFVSSKPYLERLWVAQEIFEGRGRLIVMCGEDTMSWKNWQKLVFLATTYFQVMHICPPVAARLPPYFLAMSDLVNTRHVVTFPEILESASLLLCENCMDRIYGILRLIDWASDGLQPLVPDYMLTPRELAFKAMRLSPRKTLANAGHIVNALEVDMNPQTLLECATQPLLMV